VETQLAGVCHSDCLLSEFGLAMRFRDEAASNNAEEMSGAHGKGDVNW